MSEQHAALESPPRAAFVHRPLPPRERAEPAVLTAYRDAPRDEARFSKLRRQFRDAQDWPALAHLLVVHAAALEAEEAMRPKAAELYIQAHELWLERAGDPDKAAAVLSRAVLLRPEDQRSVERLVALHRQRGADEELVGLLEWLIQRAGPGREAAALRWELGQLAERDLAFSEAASHYEQALEADPSHRDAAIHLVRLHTEAGAWPRARWALERRIAQLEQEQDGAALLSAYRTLAAVEGERMGDVAAAARHLQAALKLQSDDVDALEAFGMLYERSGKGIEKAADVFYKAAKAALRRGDRTRTLSLLRRCCALRPDHPKASAALENTLRSGEDWLALDELYRGWLAQLSGAAAVPLLLRRAELLETHLHRNEDARVLYETAMAYEAPGELSWRRLHQIYTAIGDHRARAALFEAELERAPDRIAVPTLLAAARLYWDELGLHDRAAFFFYKALEREPFNADAFEGYKEHFRRKHDWVHLRDVILYQLQQASAQLPQRNPFVDPRFAEEFVELADICERRLGDIDAARATWERMAATYPADPRPARNLGRIEKRARMWDNMLRMQEPELERTTDPAKRLEILKRLTQVYRDRQVDPQRAVAVYTEVLRLSPEDVHARRALTSLYDRAGDYPQAIALLRQQYEHTPSIAEKQSVLRRMAELWHHELASPDEAIWACEQILTLAPGDAEATTRLHQILEEQGRWTPLFERLQHELQTTIQAAAKADLLARMARLAERELRDRELACDLLEQLLVVRPTDLDLVDRLIHLYEAEERWNDVARLLQRIAQQADTPVIRRVDALLRQGQLARVRLGDPGRARASFEEVLQLRPDHRGALEALVALERESGDAKALVRSLGRLQQQSVDPGEALSIARERATLLADALRDPAAAAAVLEERWEAEPERRVDLGPALLEAHRQALESQDVVRHAELLLLATSDPAARRTLYQTITDAWSGPLGNPSAALRAFRRYMQEAPGDLEGLSTQSELELTAGEVEAALHTLGRRLELAADPALARGTLQRMAEVAETRAEDPTRALAFLREAVRREPFEASLLDRARELAARHDLWPALLPLYEEREAAHARSGDADGQVALCTEAAELALQRLGAPDVGFDWTRRAYFTAIDRGRPHHTLRAQLELLADQHGLWLPLLEVIEAEQARFEANGDPEYDFVARLLLAAEVAEERLADPAKAVALLQRAHGRAPGDESLAQRLELTAERHGMWAAVIEVEQGRLIRATEDGPRFDACVSIARIEEEELRRPAEAFGWLQRAHEVADPRLSEEAFDRMLALCERHGLWALLAEHHLGQASLVTAPTDRLDALLEAADIFHQRLGDPLGALRVLAHAAAFDPQGERVLPPARALADELDARRPAGTAPIGTLALLMMLQRICAGTPTDAVRLACHEERARVREEKLAAPRDAMAEWLRVLQLEPDHLVAVEELERLAEIHALHEGLVLLHGWRLHEAEIPEAREDLYARLADLFATRFERPEYALRALLERWRLHPALPPLHGKLDDEHRRLWSLAGEVGAYETPPVPRDPLLSPRLEAPELADRQRWIRAGLELDLLDRLPWPHDPQVEPRAPATDGPGTGDDTQEVSLADLDAELEELDEVEELEELELEDLVEDGTVIAPIATMTPGGTMLAPPPGATMIAPAPSRPSTPPPPPREPTQGLAAVPELEGPVLPPRPRVSSAWAEVARAYAEAPAPTPDDRVGAALVLSRLWEAGAVDLERAFRAAESALRFVPEHAEALAWLRELGERHEDAGMERLAKAYETLLDPLEEPSDRVAMGLRLAQLQEERRALDHAERHYRRVLRVEPRNVDALRALCRLYEPQGRTSDYVEVYADLLDAERAELDEERLVARTMELARILSQDLQRYGEAIDRLSVLVRQVPHRAAPHRFLIELLLHEERWQPAIEAMRVASEHVPDPDFRVGNAIRAAEIYETRLGLLDRAIAAWSEVLDVREDPTALEKLQHLYLSTGRHEDVLPIIDRRLTIAQAQRFPQPHLRVALLLAKAKTQREGLNDEEGALQTLQALHREAPQHDDVVVALAEAYRARARYDEALDLLRDHAGHLAGQDPERELAVAHARIDLLEERRDARGALVVLEETLERFPEAPGLRQRMAALARQVDDPARLASALSHLPDLDDQLEAAELYRGPADDPARARALYEGVLRSARPLVDDPDAARHLQAALEGLVRLEVEQADHAKALAFVDEQLARADQPSARALLLTERGRITFRHTGDVEAAGGCFDEALREDAGYARAKLGKAEVLLEAGRAAEAEQLLVEAVDALELSQGHPDELVEALVALARVLESGGRAADAHRRLAIAARHAPENLEVRAAIVANRSATGRHREAAQAAAEAIRNLPAPSTLPARKARAASEIMVLAAQAEQALGQDAQAVAAYRKAAELDPSNPSALRPLVSLCRELGLTMEAARHAETLAQRGSDPAMRAHVHLQAARLWREARLTTTDGERDGGASDQELERAAIGQIETAIQLLDGVPPPKLDAAHVEVAYETCAQAAPTLALRVLQTLAPHDLAVPGPERPARVALLLRAAELALRCDESELALAWAGRARALDETSAAAVSMHARVLEASGRGTEVEGLLEAFLDRDHPLQPGEAEDRVRLLRALADHQESEPAKAAATLERAAAIAPQAMTAEDRKRLARLYDAVDPSGAQALANHRQLLQRDPLWEPGLRSVGQSYLQRGEAERARPFFELLARVRPTDGEVREILGRLPLTEGARDTAPLPRPAGADGGVDAVLALLWEHVPTVLGEVLPRVEVPPAARVSPLGEGVLGPVWKEVLDRFGPIKAGLVDRAQLDLPSLPAGLGTDDPFLVYGQALILARAPDLRTASLGVLRFGLARAVLLSRPPGVFAVGYPKTVVSRLLSAALQAFHPRHARRKHYPEPDEGVARLGQELARKLPPRAARQLGQWFKEREQEPFDSVAWRAWHRQSADRIAYAWAGTIDAAITVLAPEATDPAELRRAVAQSADLRALLSFALEAG